MTTDADRFQRNYLIGLGSVAGLALVLAFRSKDPSRGLAMIGAATAASGLYVAATWEQTKRMAAEVAADMAAAEVQAMGERLFGGAR